MLTSLTQVSSIPCNPMIDEGIHVITRWRKDGSGWDDPISCHGKRKRGRPRKYGTQHKLSNLLNSFTPEITLIHIHGQLSRVAVLTRDMWLRDVKQKVRVVVVQSNADPVILVFHRHDTFSSGDHRDIQQSLLHRDSNKGLKTALWVW